MGYHQLTSGERHALSALRKQGFSQAGIARALDRSPSTISREITRNSRQDRAYRPAVADEMTRGRRTRSRRNRRFRGDDWALVCSLLQQLWSPEQITGRLARAGVLRISHETIYRYVWEDRRRGGLLYQYLRGARKKKWKRYRSYDCRGRLAGKRPISERPPGAENRSRVGHLEGDTVIGSSDRHCVLTLVDRKTGYLLLGKLRGRTADATNRCATSLIRNAGRRIRTVTLNCLIRQYLPKRQSMARVTRIHCDRIAAALNHRPRKRLGFLTPAEIYENQPGSTL